MNIPNILTIIRFLVVPVFCYFMIIEDYHVSVALYVFAGITDILDGQIARRFNMITSFGKLADPVADKSMQISALVLLTLKNKIPPVFLIIVIAKELFMVAGSLVLYKKDHYVVSANWYGKMATVLLFIAVILTLFNIPYNNIFVFIAVLANLFSFVMYTREYRKIKQPNE